MFTDGFEHGPIPSDDEDQVRLARLVLCIEVRQFDGSGISFVMDDEQFGAWDLEDRVAARGPRNKEPVALDVVEHISIEVGFDRISMEDLASEVCRRGAMGYSDRAMLGG